MRALLKTYRDNKAAYAPAKTGAQFYWPLITLGTGLRRCIRLFFRFLEVTLRPLAAQPPSPHAPRFKKLLYLLAAVLLVCMAAPCSAGSTRGEVFLDSDTITVGDVFDGVGEAAAKPIGLAPEAGKKIAFDVSALTQIAKTNKIDWTPKSNYERVTITRASQSIKAAMVKDMVMEQIASIEEKKDFDIALDNQSLEIHLPTNVKMAYHLADLKHDKVARRFTASLIVESDGQQARIVPVSGRAMPMIEVAMLREATQGGTVLGDSDIEWTRMPMDKAGADAITNKSQLQGTQTHHAMNAQTVVRMRDLIKERMVAKGALVMMHVDTPTMSLTAQGRALGDGAMGDTIRVTNVQSNRTIDAVITGREKVSVITSPAPTSVALK
jgi:flagella basal body P-ring formation protein FlgA